MVDYAHAGRYGPEIFEDGNRKLLRNKPVTVYVKGTDTLATLYSDRDNTPGPNPFLTDNRGNGSFFAEPGEYDMAYAGQELMVTVMIDFEDLAIGSPGAPGTPGTPGTPGAAGPPGVANAGAFPFTFSTTTTDSDPGSGNIRLNNATPSSATFVYIDDLTSGGVDISGWLNAIDDGTTVLKGYVEIVNALQTKTRIYSLSATVTDAGTYTKIPIVHVGGSGTFTNGEAVYFRFNQVGRIDVVTIGRAAWAVIDPGVAGTLYLVKGP